MSGIDTRLAARSLRRTPWFAATTILVLALAIGGSTLVFGVVETLLLRQLPYHEPRRLVTVYPQTNLPIFEQLRSSRAFERIGAYTRVGANVRLAHKTERARVALVTDGLLEAIGVRPALGRSFRPDESQPGKANVVLLTDYLWRVEFHADRGVLGRTLVLDDRAYTIVGVLPESFRTLTELEAAAEATYERRVVALVPEGGYRPHDRSWRSLTVVARLGRGMSVERARAEFTGILERTPRPPLVERWQQTLVPVTDVVNGTLPAQLALLSLAVGILTLVACANVTNLLLGRGEERRRELAIRAAMGASVASLARSLLVEAVLLSSVAGIVGLGIAWVGLQAIKWAAGGLLTRIDELTLSVPHLFFAAVLSVAAGLLTGLLPAVRLARTDTARWLHLHAMTPRAGNRPPLIRSLVIYEVALSLLLVVDGALLARDFAAITTVDLGFRPQGVLVSTITVGAQDYAGARPGAFFSQLLEQASALQNVSGAALANVTPGGHAVTGAFYQIEGRSPGPIMARWVSADYFTLLSIPTVAGRAFTRDDMTGPGVLVVNEAFAAQYWGSAEAALGRRLLPNGSGRSLDADKFGQNGYRVVGVVAEAKEHGWESRTYPEAFFLDRDPAERQRVLLLRARNGDAGSLAAPLRAMVHALDPYQPLSDVRRLEDIVSARLVRPRLLVAMMTGFAVLALVLASAGLHGMMAYFVALNRREIAVRLALGSTRRQVLRLVLARTLRLLTAGVAIGIPVTLVLTWFSAARIFAVTRVDPLICVSAVILVFLVGLGASFAPAWKASCLEFVAALKED